MKQSLCRFCGEPLAHTFVDLGMSPLCESYVEPERANEMEPFYPLHVKVCAECLLVQLDEYVSPDTIFGHYAYFSSYSDSWLDHARRYVEMAIVRFGLGPESRVIEIASNDGYLLQYFVERKIPVVGIEPAANVAEAAVKKGVPSIARFFGCELARELRDKGQQADLLLGNNVLAHVPDINDFVGGMKILLKPGGHITMEFPHLMRLVEGNQFDTIYHEHFSYLSLTVVQRIFAAHGLVLFDVEELPTHGGSLRIYARHAEAPSPPVSEAVANLLAREADAGMLDLAYYRDFGARVINVKCALLSFLIETRHAGKSIAGYGAPGKGNTLLNYCGIRSDLLPYTVDRNPFKHGLLLPGTRIPIYPPERIAETRPDYIFILPWNLRSEIMNQLSYARAWGAKFVVPIPGVEILA